MEEIALVKRAGCIWKKVFFSSISFCVDFKLARKQCYFVILSTPNDFLGNTALIAKKTPKLLVATSVINELHIFRNQTVTILDYD